ncbi:stomatin-like protein 1 [Rhinatrema bivittatum]|uniref:stomatin-like protein 1 n=1 Tax=Rhinatrema bivittatum TaxID=194408 RepID=UPI0011278518|nr:stomatin-like protein 1 [Rhinatrema bivittatum]
MKNQRVETKNKWNSSDKSQSWLSWICHGIVTILVFALLVLTFPISAWFALKIIPKGERIVVCRLGRTLAPKGPGMTLLLPLIDQWQQVDLRPRDVNVPPFKVTTKDGAVIWVSADIQFRVWNPVLSVKAVQCSNTAIRMTAQNLMTATLSKMLLREIQTEKLHIKKQLLVEINEMTMIWGLKVDRIKLIFKARLKPVEPAASQITDKNENPDVSERSVEVVSDMELPPLPPAPPPSMMSVVSKADLSTDTLISEVELVLSESLVKQVGACYQFNIIGPEGEPKIFFLDLSKGKGKVGLGKPETKPAVILEMSEDSLQAMIHGDVGPLGAYMSGRLQVYGDFKTALKLEEVFKVFDQ